MKRIKLSRTTIRPLGSDVAAVHGGMQAIVSRIICRSTICTIVGSEACDPPVTWVGCPVSGTD